MIAYQGVKYDNPRNWIKQARQNNIKWEDIYFARRSNEYELENFLKNQEIDNFWIPITTKEWFELVNSVKATEEESLKAEERSKSAILGDPTQNNSSSIPRDEKSSWQLYKQSLQDKGFNNVAIDQIEKASESVLNRLSIDTHNTNPIKGLVVGNVQSGKTANMAGVMAMAADHGWNMFIVLSGLVENLREQTQERLINDLKNAGNISWQSLTNVKRNAPSGNRAQDLILSEQNNAYLYVCLKNKSWLENLLDWMQQDPNKYEQMKILVIDDEADQGSINTADIESNERKTINRLIVNLVEGKRKNGGVLYKQPQAMNYISYTATPYANFLNEYTEESLYPRNFIKTLSTTNEYFGPKEIFGVEGEENLEGMDIVREIPSNQVSQMKNVQKNQILSIPDSLVDSICWFLSATASLKLNGYKKPVTMMVHTSQIQKEHDAVSSAIRKWLTTKTKQEILNKCKEVWEKETERFNKNHLSESYPEYSGDFDKMYEFQPFSEIESTIAELVKEVTHIPLNEEGDLDYHEHIHLCVDNSSNNGLNEDEMFVRLAYPSSEKQKELNHATAFIVVGGTTLSRGLTMEGLVSTYFMRGARQADTLMQMGRWFGYRPRYEIYPRIWMEESTIEKFKFLSDLEYELREQLQHYEYAKADPSEFGPRVKNTPKASWLRVTARDRQQAAELVGIDYTGTNAQTILFNNDKQELAENIRVTENFLSNLGSTPEKKGSRYIFRDIDFSVLSDELLKELHFHDKARLFNAKELEPFIEWVKTKTDDGLLDNWNVILSGKHADNLNEDKIWQIPDVGELGKVTRTQKQSNTNEDIINIGVLRAPSDLYADVDKSQLSEEYKSELEKNNPSTKKIGEIRKDVGLQNTPQLVIYLMDRDSKVTKDKNGNYPKLRKDLNSVEDIVGLSIRIPNINTSTGKTYGELQINIPTNE